MRRTQRGYVGHEDSGRLLRLALPLPVRHPGFSLQIGNCFTLSVFRDRFEDDGDDAPFEEGVDYVLCTGAWITT